MPRSANALVNPDLLVWARESAAMEIEDAARRLRVPPEKLRSWESGDPSPTVKQLLGMARLYRQSFAAFYLPTPPKVFKPPLTDYRVLPAGKTRKTSSGLWMDVREAMDRRAICLEFYGDRGESPPEFNATATISEEPEKVGETIRSLLEIQDSEQQRWGNPRIALNCWREAIESMGVLVFQSTDIDLSEMRGYSLAAQPLPVIVVNRKDAYAARQFTLLHELTHLMLHTSGLCDLEIGSGRRGAEHSTEVFCNHVAGAALVPRALLLAEPVVKSHRGGVVWEDGELKSLASTYSVSREVILRRLLIAGRTNQAFYQLKCEQFRREYERLPKREGFVPPSVDLVSAAGKPFVTMILNAYHDDRVTASDVSEYFGVKLKHLDKIHELVGLA